MNRTQTKRYLYSHILRLDAPASRTVEGMEKWLSAKKMKGYSLGTYKGKQFKPSKDLVSLHSPAEDDLLSRVATN
jgi:hypothetical protein